MSEQQQTLDEIRLELYEIMAGDLSFEKKADQALELGKTYLGVDSAHLTRVERGTDFWKAIASTDSPDGQFPAGLVLDLQTTYCRRTLAEGESVSVSDAPAQGWDHDPAFESHGLQCYHGTPITVGDDEYGTVCFVSKRPRQEAFTESETLFAELIARLLEHELERQRFDADATRRANSITVLSRVLRHNLRNEMTIVRGRFSHLVDRIEEDNDDVDGVFDSIDRVIALSDKARKLETVISSRFERTHVAIEPLLERIRTAVAIDFPDATIDVETPADLTIEALDTLELALTELVENGVKHACDDPEVQVTVAADAEQVAVSVADSGPGIPQQEQEVITDGVETPLVHGRGLGLWMVYWIVNSHDGSIDASVTADGTTITVRLPRVTSEQVTSTSEEVQRLDSGVDRFEAIFQESFDGMLIVNDDLRIIDANQQAGDLFEVPDQELLGRTVGEFAADSFDMDAAWDALLTAGRHEGRFPLVTAAGNDRTLEYSAAADVVPGQHLLIGRDVTERDRREQALTEANRQLEAVMRSVEAAIFIKDGEGRYQLMNRECRELMDVDADADVVGLTDDHIFPETDAERIREQDARVLEDGETVEIEEEIPANGDTRTVLTLKSPLSDDAGSVDGLVGVATDVTDRE